ncbi:golgi transport complex component [Niveomyces insectorum RCEF 264]|uniref:Conserved oligomeric Golgi complex subunit 5 n=1 Tax=Niveomyces insectorum RCEF 264 TaxID=1081102 RepID=A0A167SMW8_9HYPO|nr:golgi transport complex component [Niveomyces insectorum RCEF 264]
MAQPAGDNDDEPSYIDYETFLAPEFDPHAFANTLVLATNDPHDAPLDLATPLSRVLFDIQEIDSHIDLLTARAAVPLLTHAKDQTETSTRVVADLEPQIQSLNASYRRLEKEVIQKHAEADEVRQVAQRLWETQRLGRSVARCLQLGRQLEVQHAELGGGTAGAGDSTNSTNSSSTTTKREDHRALVRCAHTILGLREILQHKAPGEEGFGLDKVDAVRQLQDAVVAPVEKAVRDTADRIVREFSLGAGAAAGTLTFAQSEEAKARTASALVTLYLLSPTPTTTGTTTTTTTTWVPATLLQTLEAYLRAALQSSLAALARSLASLPTLERTLGEVSARCQNIVALETLLASIKAPVHPLLSASGGAAAAAAAAAENGNMGTLLQPLLAKLETGSLPAFFWRTLASHLSPRVQDIVTRGGVAARTLRSNKTSVGDAIRECVLRGMQSPDAFAGRGGSGRPAVTNKTGNWEREMAVMVGSVTGHLNR